MKKNPINSMVVDRKILKLFLVSMVALLLFLFDLMSVTHFVGTEYIAILVVLVLLVVLGCVLWNR